MALRIGQQGQLGDGALWGVHHCLKQHFEVAPQVTVETPALDIVQAHGIMGWKGGAELLERIALDPEFLPEEAS